MTKSTEIINLPKILDRRGNLSFIESENHVPFKHRNPIFDSVKY